MQIEVVRHHRCSHDADGELEHLRISHNFGRWRETKDHPAPVGIGEGNLNGKTGGNYAEQGHHERFDPAKAQLLHGQNKKNIERSDDDADFQRNVEKKIEADRGAYHFGKVRRTDGDLGQQPKRKRHGAGKGVAAGLGEIAPGADPQPRAERLQQDCHEVRKQRDREQHVAELRAAGERSRPIARVHVADGDEIAGPEKGDELSPQRAVRPGRDRAEDLRQRRRAAAAPPPGFGVSRGGRRLLLRHDGNSHPDSPASPFHNVVANNLQLHRPPSLSLNPASLGLPMEQSTLARIEGPRAPSMRCSTLLLASARESVRAGCGAALALVLSAGVSFAAEGAKSSASDVIFLAQLITLMIIGRLLGELMNRIGQPSVMGMLLGGVMLGPSVLGALWPDLQHALFPSTPEQKAMLDGISQFGILLLLLLTGMETDLKLVRTVGKAALSISVTGVAVPFICGFMLGQWLPESLLPHSDQRLLTSLFLGTALSISSIKIVAAIVRGMGFIRRNLGQIIVAVAICGASIGWVIIAVIFTLAQAGTIDPMSVTKSVLGTAIFLIASFTVGRRLVYFFIRWTNDHFESDFPVITTILVI